VAERDSAIFRACYATYCRAGTSVVANAFRRSRRSVKSEEYVADFTKVAKRTLSADDYPVFEHYFLLGASARSAAGKLKLDMLDFLLRVQRIEAQLGRAFAELEPHPLYPVAAYFARAA
jgi:hypothetical protein